MDTCTSQLDELAWALPDTLLDQASTCYDISNASLRQCSEVLTIAFATAVNACAHSIQLQSPSCMSQRQATPTSSSCSDSSDSPSGTPGCESPLRISADAGTTPKSQIRHPGRPKLNPIARSASSASTEGQYTTSIPHKLVERKYRNSLNLQLERLRRAIPALLQGDDSNSTRQPKQSKSTVITAAINHIKMVTLERDSLQSENAEISKYRKERSSSKRR